VIQGIPIPGSSTSCTGKLFLIFTNDGPFCRGNEHHNIALRLLHLINWWHPFHVILLILTKRTQSLPIPNFILMNHQLIALCYDTTLAPLIILTSPPAPNPEPAQPRCSTKRFASNFFIFYKRYQFCGDVALPHLHLTTLILTSGDASFRVLHHTTPNSIFAILMLLALLPCVFQPCKSYNIYELLMSPIASNVAMCFVVRSPLATNTNRIQPIPVH
jgi:hypothetical protein